MKLRRWFHAWLCRGNVHHPRYTGKIHDGVYDRYREGVCRWCGSVDWYSETPEDR